jgi:mitogen-activated protein kinase kinase kinase
MIRVTNFFETQVRVPIAEQPDLRLLPFKGNINGNGHNNMPAGRTGMNDEQIVGWYHKILESVRLRYRKLQRFVRYAF